MKSSISSVRRARRDWIVAAALMLIVFALGFCQLTRGVPYWGDDSAAYMSEGIAIARGELREQARRNLELHPSPLPDEAMDSPDGLVYVWGYPLLLAAVYKLVGFDAANYTSVLYYKFPSLVCLSLLAGILYFFLRRRFSPRISAPAALAFCLTGDFIYTANTLYSDVCFLCFAALSLLLLDLFLAEAARVPLRGGAMLGLGAALGASLWFGCELRLNGVSLCLAALCGQLILLAGGKERRSPRALLLHLFPYLLFFALRLISERLIFLPPTSNMSDMGSASLMRVLYNIGYYGYFTLGYFNSLTGFHLYAGILLCIPCLVGFVRDGFKRENLHLTLLFVGTYLFAMTLPYGQQLRYLYPILPVMCLYLLWGLRRIYAWLLARGEDVARRRKFARAAGCFLLALVLAHAAVASFQNLASGRAPGENEMYAPQAVEMYRYIRENTPEDAVIACVKPRALYLNTGRRSYHAGFNGNELLDADYYLCLLSPDFAERNIIPEEQRGRFRVLHETRDYAFYEILPQ